MEFIVTKIEYKQGIYHHGLTFSPNIFQFTFTRTDAITVENHQVVEIALSEKDEKIEIWKAAFDEKRRFVFDISII